MKKAILISFACMAAAIVSASCDKQLDIDQHGVLNKETYYQTDQDATEAATAIYASLVNLYTDTFSEGSVNILKNVISDDYLFAYPNERVIPLNYFYFDSEFGEIESSFATYYSVIARCNCILDNVQPDSNVKKQMIAEARAVRAWMYFDLTTLWSTPPIVDHVLSPEEANVPNGDPAKLWEMMENDLTEAIGSGALTQKASIDDRTNYRITRQFAQALLGKVYLWQGKNAEAAKVLDEVIGSGLYGLFEGDYGDIMLPANDNCRESLFEINLVQDENNPNSQTFIPLWEAMMGWGSIFDTESNGNPLDIYPNGWSFASVSNSLYDAFVAEEGADGYRLGKSVVTFDGLSGLGYSLKARSAGNGLWSWKFRMDKSAMNANNESIQNIRVMRYAEVLLLSAEANLAAGNQGKADEYLNAVRTRAHLAPKSGVTLEDIKTEKRLELYGEGVRFQDLVRWGDADKVLAGQGQKYAFINVDGTVDWNTTGLPGYQPRNKHLPFPGSEVRMNKALEQHDDWK